MASSIKYDGTELVGTTYYPQYAKHESAPDRQVSSLTPAREDGEVVVAERYSLKKIQVVGVITGSSQADLEGKIDIMKELFSRPERNLDLDWNGSTRRYVASVTMHQFDRDHFNIAFCRWSAEFTVFSGEGKDTVMTTALNAHTVTVTTPGTDSFVMGGSKAARPIITLVGTSNAGQAKGIEYKNTDTGEKIVITNATGLGSGGNDTAIIDCLAKKVTANFSNGVFTQRPFYGAFPRFRIGTNNVRISFGNIVNQSSSDPDFTASGNAAGIDMAVRQAQGFMVPYTDGTFQSVLLSLYKDGAPSSQISVRIETDANGAPSGTLADTNLATSFAASAITAGNMAFLVTFSAPGILQANTKYWLVVASNGSGDDGANRINWIFDSVGDYGNGRARVFNGSWTDTSQHNFRFRINYGGLDGFLAGVTHTVTFYQTYL